MHRRVLLVGQCAMDFAGISRMLRSHFSVAVDGAETLDATRQQVQRQTYDLILVNRVLDADGTAGLEVVRALVENSGAPAAPVMLISNFPAFQQEAVEAGAVPGFGKQQLDDAETVDRLRPLLS
jgi:CheY-like chemotaxis protein